LRLGKEGIRKQGESNGSGCQERSARRGTSWGKAVAPEVKCEIKRDGSKIEIFTGTLNEYYDLLKQT
jgi:hypothetical protein